MAVKSKTPAKKRKKDPFLSKTKPQQRVALAKDALKWLKDDLIKAETGTVCELDFDDAPRGDQVQPYLIKAIKNKDLNCDVCLRGALLLAAVFRNNHFTCDELEWSSGMYSPTNRVDQRLNKHFSRDQIALMEGAFEGSISPSAHKRLRSAKNREAVLDFCLKYNSDHERMVAILKNLIKNKGTFKLF